MTSYLATALMAAGLMASPTGPLPDAGFYARKSALMQARGACDHAVEQALALTGGELLSVEPARNGRPICKVTVLVVKPNGRPKKIKVRVPMDF
ncbi:MAG: hypothetical protein KDJ87_20040 [Rhizobiaceae bacterium]|nr:hypothetical protein [Rhizobiaceae bacterium]